MKAVVYDLSGKKKKDIELPGCFSGKIREDIIKKYFEASKFRHPSSPDAKAGKKHSASGIVSHKRHDWKGHYGRGVSRIPRKAMWRRGNQFFWVGAEIASTRGGRRAHPPKGIGKEKKINKKEIEMAFNTGFAASADKTWIQKRYSSLEKIDIVPVIVDSFEKAKAKDVKTMLKKVFGDAFELVLKKREVRSGKGKMRGRKYKSNAGALVVKGKDENFRMNGLDVKSAGDVTIADLYPLGRLIVYTEKALKELEDKKK